MAREAWHHSTFTATWVTKMELAWRWSVTTVKAERTCRDMRLPVVTPVTFITQGRVCLSSQVLQQFPHTVNSLLSTSVITQLWRKKEMPGGYHVILVRWRTGAVHHPAVVGAHAGWPTHVQTPVMVATVIRMTGYGVKTAVFSLTRHIFQLYS